MRITRQAFMAGDIQYRGEFKTLIGQSAVDQYLQENTNRKPGIRRIIFTGRWLRMRDNPDQPKTVAEPEHYEEVDYGTGRLLQALKSSLRTSYKGTSIFGKYFTVEELIGQFVKNFKEVAEKESGGILAFTSKRRFPAMKLLAQLFSTYILAQGEKELFVIDQHAAHERVLYEEYLIAISNKKTRSQYLLTPLPLELSHAEFLLLNQYLSLFHELGFLLEPFGGDSFLLRGVPQGFPDGKEFPFFLDTIDHLITKGKSTRRQLLLDNLIASLACHSSIKAGERLALPAMEALVKRLANTENPFNCPHGRPTIIQLSCSQLELWFKRT